MLGKIDNLPGLKVCFILAAHWDSYVDHEKKN